jgi:hypothetical protein
MDSYIVVFETNTKQAEFDTYLQSLSKWGKITATSYLVKSSKTAAQIRDYLFSFKSPGDRVAVIKSGYIAAWSNTRASNDWVKNNL